MSIEMLEFITISITLLIYWGYIGLNKPKPDATQYWLVVMSNSILLILAILNVKLEILLLATVSQLINMYVWGGYFRKK